MLGRPLESLIEFPAGSYVFANSNAPTRWIAKPPRGCVLAQPARLRDSAARPEVISVLTSEVLVIFNVKCGFYEHKTRMQATTTGRKLPATDAGDFVLLRMSRVVNHSIGAGMRHPIIELVPMNHESLSGSRKAQFQTNADQIAATIELKFDHRFLGVQLGTSQDLT